MESFDPYLVLELGRDVTADEVKAAYRRLVLKYHPDRNQGFQREAEGRFKDIARAFEILRDEQRRRQWDSAAEARRRDQEKQRSSPAPAPASGAGGSNHRAASSDSIGTSRWVRLRETGLALRLDVQVLVVRARLSRGRRHLKRIERECGMFVVNNALELLTPELTLWREVILEVRRYVLDAVQELRSAEHSLHQAAQSVELGRKEALVARIAVLKRNIAEQGHKLIELHEGLGREIIDHGGDPRFAGFRDRTAVVVKAIKVSEQRLETLREQRRALDGKLLIAPRKLASITVATLVLLAVAIVWHRGGSGAAIALTRDQLPLASPYLEVTWETWRAGHWEGFSWVNVPNAAEAVAGSTGMVKVEGDRLYLITNRHVLDLAGVRAATTNTAQFAVLKYQATVTFPSHRERQILRFGCPESAVDLAMLEVDGRGLEQGTDFVLLPNNSDAEVSPGDEVVAVGSPSGLLNTQTFGRVSALRNLPETGAGYLLIQTDAAINPGNSGGPLFLKRNDAFQWVGINTWGVSTSGGSQGLNFAIHTKPVFSSQFKWYAADKEGAGQALVNGEN